MSGRGVDLFVRYERDEKGCARFRRHCVFPRLRTIPNNTHGSFQTDIPAAALPTLRADGATVEDETLLEFRLYGLLEATAAWRSLRIRRRFYPCEEALCAVEQITVENRGDSPAELSLLPPVFPLAARGRGTKGVYLVETTCTGGEQSLLPGKQAVFYIYYTARIASEILPRVDGERELRTRLAAVRGWMRERLDLETGIPLLDSLFAFSKLRAGESIFRTDGGLLHSPGGRDYYAATWCNDQIEYAGPFFATAADPIAMEASLNAYRQYIPFMDDGYTRIPSSVIAEGRDIWEGAGDRGDGAMYLYGASLFALYSGSGRIAGELFPAIEWCAEYCKRKRLPEGVIGSDTDELEGRFPTDRRANLSTSMLCLGGLRLAAVLAEELGEKARADEYRTFAGELKESAERYFAATLHGYETYRYSRGYDTLRGWISLPLVMGMDRAKGTADALLSPYLRSDKGLLSCEIGDENPAETATVWDRAALYGFKGLFLTESGERLEKVFADFLTYCGQRHLGGRVPYPVEAYPEGNMRHLSGESALFCRVITEGMLGIRPTGLHSFSLTPHLPAALPRLRLDNLFLCGGRICVEAEKARDEKDRGCFRVAVRQVPESGEPILLGCCTEGETLHCTVRD